MVSLLTGVLLILFFPAFGLRCAFPTFYSGTVAADSRSAVQSAQDPALSHQRTGVQLSNPELQCGHSNAVATSLAHGFAGCIIKPASNDCQELRKFWFLTQLIIALRTISVKAKKELAM